MTDVEGAKNENPNTELQQKSDHWFASTFINAFEMAERAAYYTIKVSTPMYLYLYLGYSRTATVVFYHLFEAIASFSCLFGAILADGHIGKFRTILFSSMLHFLGMSCLIVSAMQVSLKYVFTFIGLTLCAVACGCIRPTIAAFGGDQFPKSSYQEKLFLFYVIYFAFSHLGMFLGQLLGPLLRDFKPCTETECYILPFVSGLLLLVCAIVTLMFGQNRLKIVPVKTHVATMALKAIALGATRKIKAKRNPIPPQPHWLDHALPECGIRIVEDTKILMKLLLLTLPVPLFFIVYCQKGSNWVYQASAMNRTMGTIEPIPELIVLVYPMIALVFAPIYYFIVNPFLNLLRLRSLIQKITIGAVLATVSMVLAAVIEAQLERTQLPPQRRGICQLRIYNGLTSCSVTINSDLPEAPNIRIKPLRYFEHLKINVKSKSEFTYNITSRKSDCPNIYYQKFILKGRSALSFFVTKRKHTYIIRSFADVTKKPIIGAKLRILATGFDKKAIIIHQENEMAHEHSLNSTAIIHVSAGIARFELGRSQFTHKFASGDVQTLLLSKTRNSIRKKILPIAPSNTLPVYWLIPQYVFLAMADVILTISFLHFAYVKAPASMKTLFIGCWYLTILLGNLLLMLVTISQVFTWKKDEYIFYAVLMIMGTTLFAILARLFHTNSLENY